MDHSTKFVGLDVHKDTIVVAVADWVQPAAREVGTYPHTPEAVRKIISRLGKAADLQVCYEAGPTGYGLYRLLTQVGVTCMVVAPSLTPIRPGDRIKTDRRDARRLAELLRAGELTPVWVPDESTEALRDLVRARHSAKTDLRRARQAMGSFLLRQGVKAPEGTRRWSKMFMRWLDTLSFDQRARQVACVEYLQSIREAEARVERLEAEIHAQATDSPHAAVIRALQALKGISEIAAVTLVAEIGEFSRFRSPAQLMAYAGLVPGEHSSGATCHRGGITHAGNAHVRFVLGEASWAQRYRPAIRRDLRKRQEGLEPDVVRIALKAQERLHRKYWRLLGRGKAATVAATAVARELLGFAWAIACHVEAQRYTTAA